MKKKIIILAAGATLSLVMSTYCLAAETDAEADEKEAYAARVALSQEIKKYRGMRRELPIPPPSGLFGVYAFPEQGQFVAGINFQHFEFNGMLQGSDSISAAQVVASVPNRFFGDPMQPKTLRVVPDSAKADVMFPFVNYAYNEKFSLVALVPMIKKSTVLETFNAPGTASLGTNEVTAAGLGDIKFGTLYKLFNAPENKHNVIIDMVLSAPTGSIKEDDDNLTPMNTMQKSRLGYGMQLGSGTWDALVGVAYWGKVKKWGWGAQYLATIPLESENSQGWSYGDKHEGTVWVSYAWDPTFNSNLRLRTESQGEINGIDPLIYGPGVGGDPDNYGGTRTDLSIGANWMYARAHNISIEYAIPLMQDRNGVQADFDQSIMLSWRNAFF